MQHARMHARTHTRTHTCTHAHTYTHKHVNKHACTHVHVHTHTQTCTCTQISLSYAASRPHATGFFVFDCPPNRQTPPLDLWSGNDSRPSEHECNGRRLDYIAYSPGFYGETHAQAISCTCGRVGKTVACRPHGTGFESRRSRVFFLIR